MTPGMRSSEFVVSLVPVALGALLMIVGAVKGNNELLEQGTWLLLGGSGSYGLARGLAKMGNNTDTLSTPAPTAPPPMKAPGLPGRPIGK